MAKANGVNSSTQDNNIDLEELNKILYFNELYLKRPDSIKKLELGALINPLPEYVEARMPSEYIDALWKAQSDSILKDAFYKRFMPPHVIAFGVNGHNVPSRDYDALPPEFIVKIRKGLNSRGRADLVRRAFIHYFFSFINGTALKTWQQICGLALCSPFLGVDAGISFQDFEKALTDEAAADALLNSLGELATAVQAFGMTKLLKKVKDDSPFGGTFAFFNELKEYSFDSIKDLIKFDNFLSRHYLPARRAYLSKLLKLKKRLSPYLDEELASSFKDTKGWAFARKFDESFRELLSRLHEECARLLPKKFSSRELLAEIDRVSPPIRPEDRESAEAEVYALERGELSPENSWLIKVIFPALRGELNYDDFDLEILEKEIGASIPFSKNFVFKFARGDFSLVEPNASPKIESPEIDEQSAAMDATEESDLDVSGHRATLSRPESENFAEEAKDDSSEPDSEVPAEKDRRAPESDGRELSISGENKNDAGASTETADTEAPEEFAVGDGNIEVVDETGSDIDYARGEISGEREFSVEGAEIIASGEADDMEEAKGDFVSDEDDDVAEIEDETAAGEDDASIRDLEDYNEELEDFENHAGVLEPLGKNFLINIKSEEFGNIGNLAETTDSGSIARSDKTNSPRSRRKRPQENADDQLEIILRRLMESDLDKRPLGEADISNDEAIAALLLNGDTAGLYWLSVCRGKEIDIPEWLTELVHIGSKMTARKPDEKERFATLLKQAIAEESMDETQKALLAAAILRPAMLMPMPDMATALQTLENEAVFRPVAHIFKKLKEIVFRDQPIPRAILQGQSGKKLAEASLDNLRENTKKFLHRMRTAKTQYQPATDARRRMFDPQGELAIPLEKCLAGNYADLNEHIRSLSDSRAYDDIINRNRGRKAITRNIEAGARETLHKEISTCLALLEEWREYASYSQRNEVDEMEAWFHDTFHNAKLDELGDAPGLRFFKRQIEILKNGLAPGGGPDPVEELRLWPLRVPYSETAINPVFKPGNLALAVAMNEQNDEELIASSLVWRALRGDYPLARVFMETFPEIDNFSPMKGLGRLFNYDFTKGSEFKVSDALRVAEKIWRDKVKDRIEELENLIVDSYFRGAININQQNEANLKLNDIKAGWKENGDALETMNGLASIEKRLSLWDETMLDEVLGRVEGLKENAGDIRDALAFLEEIARETREDKSYSVAHDNLARMEAWLNEPSRPFPKRDVDSPSQMGAGKEFYDLLEIDAIYPREDEGDLWREGAKLAIKPLRSSESVGLITSLLRWIGFNLERSEQINPSYSEGRPHYWKVFSYNMTIKSPLPNWGSRANGKHIIAMGWQSPTPADIDKLMQSGRFRHNDAVTMIIFGSLSYADRLKILKMGAEWRPFPLIIDANAFHYLARQPNDYRLQRMFEICLAGSPLNPYTPDARGDVPEEMFYGRKKDIDSVRASSGACVIFGGRQLGKSALLLQVANETDNKGLKKVFRKSIPEEATSLLEEALRCCIKEGIVDRNTSRKSFPDRLKDWITAEKDRELLLLLDECDNALEEDKKRNFAEVKTFRDLMQDTKSRFKVVFTGLHSVQRFKNEPNSPFYQLESICIGPMDTDSAYQLMTEKLALLGINFESQKLVRMALNYCNYQPKLIQMFCHELLETVKNIPGRGPNYTIDRDTMLKVYASPRLREKIRDSFTMALALDKRYFVIGYAMALNSSKAISARKLLEELRDCWPDAFKAENCDANALLTLLREMEGLGLLISLEGGWRVRTPNIIEFLGGWENILDELVQYEDLPYEQPGNPDDLRMKTANIFTASQYNLLADKSSRLQWISGWSGLGFDRAPEALKAIAASMEYGSRLVCVKISGKNKDEAMASLRKEYARVKEGGLLAWIASSEFPNKIEDFMQAASAWLGALHTDRKYAKIICLISPRDFYRFIAKGYAASLSAHEIQLKPWSALGIGGYLLDKDLPANRTAEIMEATSGWPSLIESLMNIEEINASQVKETIDYSAIQTEVRNMLKDLPQVRKVVDIITELCGDEPTRREDLDAAKPDDMDEASFDNVMAFLQSMSLLREEKGKYFLDKIAFSTSPAN